MQISVADNVSRPVVGVLSTAIERSSDVRIAVAFVSQRGVSMISAPVATALQAGAIVEFVVGLDGRATEPAAVRDLFQLARSNPNVRFYCYRAPDRGHLYHPKVYLLRATDTVTCIVGSSNLTEGGLRRNLEVNVVIEGTPNDEPVSDLYESYTRLKFQPGRVVPDEELLAVYQQLFQRQTQEQRTVDRDPMSRELRNTFNQKLALLQRPAPTRRDLVGWLELVYDALPQGDFTNAQAYGSERVFRERFPQNRNIRAKVRQQLQNLRDLGFIEHMGRARWRKL